MELKEFYVSVWDKNEVLVARHLIGAADFDEARYVFRKRYPEYHKYSVVVEGE